MSLETKITTLSALVVQLLVENECVVIPDFGGFISNYKPASLDQAVGNISPPARSIIFNPLLKHNDGLLITKFQQQNALSYLNASLELAKGIDAWKIIIASGKQIELPSLGTLEKKKGESIVFSPFKTGFSDKSAFGLKPVKALAAKEVGIKSKIKSEIEERQNVPYYRSNLKKVMYSGVAAALLLSAIIWSVVHQDIVTQKSNDLMSLMQRMVTDGDSSSEESIQPSGKNELTKDESKTLNKSYYNTGIQDFNSIRLENTKDDSTVSTNIKEGEKLTSDLTPGAAATDNSGELTAKVIKKNSSRNEVTNDFGSEKDKTKTYLDDHRPKQKGNEETIIKKYKIIAGCFSSIKNANNYVEELRNLGYSALLSGQSASGLNRVIYAQYDTKVQALKALAQIRLSHNSNAWVSSD